MNSKLDDAALTRFETVDVMEAISRRYSVREFRNEPVADEVLMALLRAAHDAPSSWNLQPWEFILVTDPAVKHELATTAVSPGNMQAVANGAATFVCLGSMRQQDALADRIERTQLPPDATPERRERVQQTLKPMREDERYRREHVLSNTFIGIAQLVLAAQKFGLGSLWMGGFDRDKVKAVLGIPDDYLVASLVTVGYPSENAVQKPRTRRPLEEIYWMNRFGGR